MTSESKLEEVSKVEKKCKGLNKHGRSQWIFRRTSYTLRTLNNGAKIVSCEYLSEGKYWGRCSASDEPLCSLHDCPHHFIPAAYNFITFPPSSPLFVPRT